ncbi:unnamed protein product [Prunus armeniaca]
MHMVQACPSSSSPHQPSCSHTLCRWQPTWTLMSSSACVFSLSLRTSNYHQLHFLHLNEVWMAFSCTILLRHKLLGAHHHLSLAHHPTPFFALNSRMIKALTSFFANQASQVAHLLVDQASSYLFFFCITYKQLCLFISGIG